MVFSTVNSRLKGLRRSCWSKTRTHSRIRCYVCYCTRSAHMFSSNYCCSTSKNHSTRQICDTCVHQYILSKLYSCLTTTIPCPEINCRADLDSSVICHILLKYDSHELLDAYLREQQWQGKSEEWIKRFAARCPGCHVPIEKNGGCDEMLCIRCQTHFYWSKAKRYGDGTAKHDPADDFTLQFSSHYILFLSCFVILAVFFSYVFSK